MKSRLNKWYLLTALLYVLSDKLFAEETFPIFDWAGDTTATSEPYPGDQRVNQHEPTVGTAPEIPAAVAMILQIASQESRRYEVVVPGTPVEAIELLEEIDVEIDRLAIAVNQFCRSKFSLIRSIDRLADHAQRNRAQMAGWGPVLAGNLRLIRASESDQHEGLWVIVAVVILEAQVERLDLRMRYASSNAALLAKLKQREDQLELRKQELLGALAGIREQLTVIRDKAQDNGQS